MVDTTVRKTPLLVRDTEPSTTTTTTTSVHPPPVSLALNSQANPHSWPYPTNASQTPITSPSRYPSTPHPSTVTPSFTRPYGRYNSGESGYWSGVSGGTHSGLSGFGSMHPSMSTSLPNTTAMPYQVSNPSIPSTYSHQGYPQQQYDPNSGAGPHGQGGAARYPYDPPGSQGRYFGQHGGHQQ